MTGYSPIHICNKQQLYFVPEDGLMTETGWRIKAFVTCNLWVFYGWLCEWCVRCAWTE